jgi:hypothetical protein
MKQQMFRPGNTYRSVFDIRAGILSVFVSAKDYIVAIYVAICLASTGSPCAFEFKIIIKLLGSRAWQRTLQYFVSLIFNSTCWFYITWIFFNSESLSIIGSWFDKHYLLHFTNFIGFYKYTTMLISIHPFSM